MAIIETSLAADVVILYSRVKSPRGSHHVLLLYIICNNQSSRPSRVLRRTHLLRRICVSRARITKTDGRTDRRTYIIYWIICSYIIYNKYVYTRIGMGCSDKFSKR